MSSTLAPSPTTAEYSLRIVIFRQGDWWVAQCLEHNLVTVVRELADIDAELQRFLTVQIAVSRDCGVEPFTGLPPARHRFWAMYEGAPHWTSKSRRLGLPAELNADAVVEMRIAA